MAADLTLKDKAPHRPWPLFKSFAGYRGAYIAPDLIAGLTLAAIAIPEQMATASLGGLGPQLGFFAFIGGTVAFIIFGASRQLSSGADSTITPIFAGALAMLAASGSLHYAALAAALALLVGAIVAASGLLRMGWIGNLLSTPVTTGFLAGIAVHILVSQLPAALGLPAPSGSTIDRIAALFRLAPHANLAALAISAGVFGVIAVAHRLSPRLPGPLAAVGLASLIVWALHLNAHGVALLGAAPGGLPHVSLPALAAADYLRLLPLALIVALVVMVQTAATSHSFPPEGREPDVDGDFIGLGMGGLFAGLLGAFPVDASPPRTAIVASGGGRSQLAGLTAVVIMLALLAFGMGILRWIPEAALAGVLIFVACRIIEIDRIRAVIKTSPAESLLIAATAVAIVALPIQNGVAVGIGLSLLHGLWSGARMKVRPMHQVPGSTIWWPSANAHAPNESQPGVVVLGFQAPLTFLNAEAFARQLLAAIAPGKSDVKLAVLEAAGIIDIDFTAAQALGDVVRACHAAGVTFAIARLESLAAQTAFERLGLTTLIGADHIFPSVWEAVKALGPPVTAA